MTRLDTQAPQIQRQQVNTALPTYQQSSGTAISRFGSDIARAFAPSGPSRSPTSIDLFDPVTDRALTEDGIPEDPEFTAMIQKEANRLVQKAKTSRLGATDQAKAIAVARRLKALNPERALQIESTFKLNQGTTLQQMEQKFFADADVEIAKQEDTDRGHARGLGVDATGPIEEVRARIQDEVALNAEAKRTERKLSLMKNDQDIDQLTMRRSAREHSMNLTKQMKGTLNRVLQGRTLDQLEPEEAAVLIPEIEKIYAENVSIHSGAYDTQSEFQSDFVGPTLYKDSVIAILQGEKPKTSLQNSLAAAEAVQELQFHRDYPEARALMIHMEAVATALGDLPISDSNKQSMLNSFLVGVGQRFLSTIDAASNAAVNRAPNANDRETERFLKIGVSTISQVLQNPEVAAEVQAGVLQSPNVVTTRKFLDNMINDLEPGDPFFHHTLILMANEDMEKVLQEDFAGAQPSTRSKWIEGYIAYKETLREYSNELMIKELNNIANIEDVGSNALELFFANLQTNVDTIGLRSLDESPLVDVTDEGVTPSENFNKLVASMPPRSQELMYQSMQKIQALFRENNFYIRKADKIWGKEAELIPLPTLVPQTPSETP